MQVYFSPLVLVLIFFNIAIASPEVPAPPQRQAIVITGATIHPVSSEAFKGDLVFTDGKITALGKRVKRPQNAKVINAAGKHVYPGMIDTHSNMGLVEVNAIRATRDYREVGDFNPNVKTQVAVNPDSAMIPVTRTNGVLLCLSVPQGGLISGQSALLQLDGWTWEDLTLKAPIGMHLQWPTMTPVDAWWEDHSRQEQVDQRDKQLTQLEDFFADAAAYRQARAAKNSTQQRDARLEAMLPVLQGELPLIVTANDLSQIRAAVAFALRHEVRLIISGGWDAPRCAALLKKHRVPVIVETVYQLPRRRHEGFDAAYTLPARLHQAGITYCVAGSGRFGASNVRNLPYHAAMAVAWGLPPAEGIKAITLNAAEILGVDDRVGSLDVGKDATLFISDGNPLETTTQIETVFIQGRKVELNDRHQRLWNKYKVRYQRD